MIELFKQFGYYDFVVELANTALDVCDVENPNRVTLIITSWKFSMSYLVLFDCRQPSATSSSRTTLSLAITRTLTRPWCATQTAAFAATLSASSSSPSSNGGS